MSAHICICLFLSKVFPFVFIFALKKAQIHISESNQWRTRKGIVRDQNLRLLQQQGRVNLQPSCPQRVAPQVL